MPSSVKAGQKYRRADGAKAIYTYHEIDDRDECNLFMSITACIVGLLAGITCHFYPIYMPSVLNDSFAFRSGALYKVLLTLIAIALIDNSVVCIVKKGITRVWSGNGVISGGIGAVVLGAGMAMCQSDPMILFVQLGTFTKSSLFTFMGALIAALSWGFIYDLLPRENTRLKPQYLDAICKGKVPFYVVAFPVALSILTFVGCVEFIGDSYKTEAPLAFKANLIYSPYFVGTVLAVLQLPLTIFFCKSLQGFCSHIATVALPVNQVGRLCNMKLPGFVRFTGSLSSSWSILMGVGLFMGSLTAGALGLKNAYFVEEGSNFLLSVTGGFLMILGSIYAGGDLFSLAGGVANLHLNSMLNLAVVIISAFATTRIFEAVGVHF